MCTSRLIIFPAVRKLMPPGLVMTRGVTVLDVLVRSVTVPAKTAQGSAHSLEFEP